MSKPRQDHQEEIMENNSKTTFFSNVELEKLRKLLNQWDNVGLNSTQVTDTCSMAHPGNSYTLNGSFENHSNTWIINSGAFEHMTSYSNFFSTYSTCSGKQNIKVADGSFSAIAGQGPTPIK